MGRLAKMGLDAIQGFATEVVSQVMLHRDAPMTGKPTLGGGAGSLAAKALMNHLKTPGPKMPTTFSMPMAQSSPLPETSSPPATESGGWSTGAIIGGLAIAAVVVGGGVYWYKYMRKAQNEGIRLNQTQYNEVIGSILTDPAKLSAFKSALYKEFAKAGMDKREIGKLIAQIVGEARKQAALADSIPADPSVIESGLAGLD